MKVLRSEIAAQSAAFNEIAANPDLYEGTAFAADLGTALRLKPEADGLLRAYDQIIAGLEESLGIIKDQGVTAPRKQAERNADGNMVSPAEASIRRTMRTGGL